MDREIEEMVDILEDNTCGQGQAHNLAKRLYNAGYHKQETCKNLSNSIDEFECSKCGYMTDEVSSCKKDDDGEIFHYDYQFKYCPNCGRKVED